MTDTLAPDDAGIAKAAGLLGAGQLVAFPTETVYGLGADARSDLAVAKVYEAKGRPSFNPLIVHLPDLAAVEAIAHRRTECPGLGAGVLAGAADAGAALAGRCRDFTAGDGGADDASPCGCRRTRWRNACCGRSAGRWRPLRPTRRAGCHPPGPSHVLDGLSGRIAAVLDGGPCAVGLESTIVLADPDPVLLRPGGLPVEALEAALGGPLAMGGDADKPTSPGQLASHYAPAAGVRLEATQARPGEVLVGFGPVKGALTLSESGDLVEAAARLFQTLREADRLAGPGGHIAFAPVPETGLGRAINDRLRRAAAPRP